MCLPIDYRCEGRNKLGDVRGDIGAIILGLTPSSRKPRSSPSKNEPFSYEMQLKIPFYSRDSKLSNSNAGCGVRALHFFVK
jgi:hypothetical protein